MYRICCVLAHLRQIEKKTTSPHLNIKSSVDDRKKSSRVEGCQVAILCRSLPISSIHKTTEKKWNDENETATKHSWNYSREKNKWIASKFQLHAVEKSRIKETKCRGTDHDTLAFFPQFFSFQNIKVFFFWKNKTNRIVKLFFVNFSTFDCKIIDGLNLDKKIVNSFWLKCWTLRIPWFFTSFLIFSG